MNIPPEAINQDWPASVRLNSKATRAYLHREADVVEILKNNGWKIERNAMTKTQFYFSRILEATR